MIDSPVTTVVMHFLGVPEVRYLGQPVHFACRKSLALLVYLVVEAGWHGREKLIALFWPESDQKRGRTSLRTAVTRLRQSLSVAADLIVVVDDKIAVDHERPFILDLQLVETAVLTNKAEACEQGLSVFRGEFLDGFTLPDTPAFDQWVGQQRLFWQQQRDILFERLCRWQLEHGETAQAVQTANQWIVRSPLNETAYRLLMEAHFLDGDRTAALRAYETCVQMLHDELGVTATTATKSLAARIRSVNPPRRDEGTAVKTRRPIELPLVGRHAEHGQLVADYRQIALGATRMVVLIGEAGIGKTKLARAFLNWATVADPGADTLQGRAFETGGRLPYQPVVEALRARIEAENAPEDLLADVWLAELSQLLPEIRDRYPDLPLPLRGEPDFVRARIFEAVARLGEALAARQPVVFFVDDIQWTDEGTLDLVHYLCHRWVENQPQILMLLTMRQEAFVTRPSLRDWLLSIGRELPLTRLNLTSLPPAAVYQLVSSFNSETNAEQTAAVRAFSDWLQAETNGQPFFIDGMLQMLIEQGILRQQEQNGRFLYDFATAWEWIRSQAQLPLPPTVQEVIQARLGRLSPAAAGLALAGAVSGRESSFAQLWQVAEVGESAAVLALEELLNGRIFVELGTNQRPYTFAHDKIRDVVYAEAGRARRHLHHRRALAVLEQEHARAAELAFQAHAARLWEPAFRYSLAAGDEAMATYAAAEALTHYNRALVLARQGTMAVTSEQLIHLYVQRGRACEWLNRFDKALQNYQKMAELAIERNDAALKLEALNAQCIVQAIETPVHDPSAARQAGEAALILARNLGDGVMESRVLSALLRAEYWDGSNYQQALAYGQQSLLIAGDLELKEQMAYTLTYLTLVYWSLDQMAAAREANLEALRAWQALDNRPMQAYTHSLTQLVHWFAGEYERSLSSANVGMDISRSTGDLWNQARASCYMAACYLEQGEYEQALASLTEGIRSGEETHLISITSMSYRFLIRTYLAVGVLEMAEKAADKLYALCNSNVFMFRIIALGTIALAKVACGKGQETQRILDEVYAEIEIEKQPVILIGFVLLADINLQLALGKHKHALERAHYLSERARQSGERLYLPEALWLQGKAFVALAQPEQAHQVLKEAQAIVEETGARRIGWHVLWELSRLEAAFNRPDAARHYRQQARKVVQYIADHAGSGELQASFLALPEVDELLSF